MATFPYNPTKALSSPASNGLIYVFQPNPNDPTTSQLFALNSTAGFASTSLQYATISSHLPFSKGTGYAYTPMIDAKGNIVAYAGQCANGSSSSMLWQLNAPSQSLGGVAQWNSYTLSPAGLDASQQLDGANYLAAGIAFSATANNTDGIYVFGGMCPTTAASDATTWTASAGYSNTMLVIDSDSSSQSHTLSMSPSRGPPVAEAGFTITPLSPTFTNSSDGQTHTQNQNYLLVGGHTQNAFINMSQVALFSLPEQSWTFINVDQPIQSTTPGLAKRQSTAIDSRSGHTALLTADGKKVVIFGGWVGDVTQSAEPQLAILELGQGYGGTGDWQWSIPSQIGPGLPTGTGIYGHGASMLDGDVMLVIGGYQVPTSSGSRLKRQQQSANSNAYLFNVTSGTWITSYTRPAMLSGNGSGQAAGQQSNETAKRAGLGVGLTIGVLVLLAAVIVFFWYSRKLQRRRRAREAEIEHIASVAQKSHHIHGKDHDSLYNEKMLNEKSSQALPAAPNMVHQPGSPGDRGAERTGLLYEVPSPTRGLRRSVHSRLPHTAAAPRFDSGRRLNDINYIHPIDEGDEDDETVNHHDTIQRREIELLDNVPMLDPFRDPITKAPHGQTPQQREREIRKWVNDWSAADAVMQRNSGSISPTKTDRTSSTLSERSAYSVASNTSHSFSIGTLSRTLSSRSAAILSVLPFVSHHDGGQTTTTATVPSSQTAQPGLHRAQSLSLVPGAPRPIMVLGNSAKEVKIAEPLVVPSRNAPPVYTLLGTPSGKPQDRNRGWMGSIRRAFQSPQSGEKNGPQAPIPVMTEQERQGTYMSSTGPVPWKRQQGAKDWDVEAGKDNKTARQTGGNEAAGADEEWDVEQAAANRVVQVMFTVPRERLRVVNRSPSGDGDDDTTSVSSAGDVPVKQNVHE